MWRKYVYNVLESENANAITVSAILFVFVKICDFSEQGWIFQCTQSAMFAATLAREMTRFYNDVNLKPLHFSGRGSFI